MSKRTAKFVSALFASLLAGTLFATVSHSATEAADSCLSGPRGSAPQGSHWYYRVDRATKRNCWYLRAEGEKVSRAAPETPAPPVTATAPLVAPKNPDTEQSIANARAELTPPQTRVEPAARALTPQWTPAVSDATGPEINQGATAGDAGDQRSLVATRWLDPANMSTSVVSQAPPTSFALPPPQSSEASAPATVTLAASEAAPAKPSGSVQTLLMVMIGALSIAGLIGSAIVRFGRPGWTGRDVIVDRRVNWDAARTDRPSLADDARAADWMREVDVPRAPRAADDPNQRIAQMLQRLARTAAS